MNYKLNYERHSCLQCCFIVRIPVQFGAFCVEHVLPVFACASSGYSNTPVVMQDIIYKYIYIIIIHIYIYIYQLTAVNH